MFLSGRLRAGRPFYVKSFRDRKSFIVLLKQIYALQFYRVFNFCEHVNKTSCMYIVVSASCTGIWVLEE